MDSGSSLGDSVKANIPGHDERIAEMIAKLPLCQKCGIRLVPHYEWDGGYEVHLAMCGDVDCERWKRAVRLKGGD